jgi:dolichyl-phosphate beta-glucosyltransferase
VIPAFNEAGRILPSLQAIQDCCSTMNSSWEILVVDDGSTDATQQVVLEFRQGCPELILLALERNHGKGAALQVGMTQARGNYILFTDSDLSTPISEMPRLLQHLQRYPIVVGDRRLQDSDIQTHQPYLREFLGHKYTWIANRILGLSTTDFTCGFKCFTREAAHHLYQRTRQIGWSCDAEIFYLARLGGFEIKPVPVPWKNHPDSRVQLSSTLFRSLLDLLLIRFRGLTRGYESTSPIPQFIVIE